MAHPFTDGFSADALYLLGLLGTPNPLFVTPRPRIVTPQLRTWRTLPSSAPPAPPARLPMHHRMPWERTPGAAPWEP
jgi:hypothetical protein